MPDPGNPGGGGRAGNNTNPNAKVTNDQDIKNAENLNEKFARLRDTLKSVAEILKDGITDQIEDFDTITQKAAEQTLKDFTKELNNASKALKESEITQARLGKGLVSSSKIESQINKLLSTHISLESELAVLKLNGVELTIEQEKAYGDIEKTLAEQLSIMLEQGLAAEAMEKSVGNLGKLFEGLTKIPIVGKLIDAKKVLAKMNEAASQGASKMQTFGVGIKATFATIGETLTDPVFLIGSLVTGFTKLIKLAADFQSKQFEAAKDLGVSVERGKELRDNFVNLARTNLGLAVTADQLQKSYAGVQNELGIIVKQSDEFNLSSTLIERRTGATAENMATLQFAAGKMGTSLMDAYQTIEGSAKAEGGRVKLAMSEKQILEGISKVSATVYANFKGNYKELAAAVVEAKKLGVSLDEINATQDQFLDFESSISKQFEAEVLTGRDLNLNKARELALAHDTKGLMEEITHQLGSQNAWGKLNSIQQSSLAESLGLSRDAVNKMYMDQEKAAILGKAAGEDLKTQYDTLVAQGKTKAEIVRLLGQESVASAQQASVSEKMAATMDAIKNSIAQASERLLPMVDAIATFLANANNLKGVFIGIATVMVAMVGYSLAMKAAGMAQVATQIQLLRLQVQQNIAARTGVVTEALLAEEKIIEAGAAATAGSWYLGPGALPVGAAVIAALGAYFGMSAIGGESSSAGTTTATPSAGMTPPVNTAIAGATTTAAAPTQNYVATPQQQQGNVYLDSQRVGSILFGNANEQYGLNKK